jgi:DNA-binding response OmpR family regulator
MGSATVLLVEDNVQLLGILREHLSASGCTVIAASAAGEALELVRGLAVQVVVCDVRLGAVRGPDLVARMRGVQPRLRAIFISGAEVDGLDARDAVLMKPFPMSQLTREVERATAV